MYQLVSKKYWPDPNIPVCFEFQNPQPPFPMHVHDFHEIAVIYSGKAVHLTANGDNEVQGGDCISVKPGQAHGFKNIRNLVLMNVLVRPSLFEENRFSLHSIPAYNALFGRATEEDIAKAPVTQFRPDFEAFGRAKKLIESASGELKERPDGYRAMVTGLMYELIALLIRSCREKNDSPARFASGAASLIRYVKDNYRSPVNMNDLIAVSAMSESNILRTFKRHLGCSPFQYISRLRLSDAADALVQTDKPITEIALDLGFNDSNYFTRSFRKHLGLSPREYRKKYLQESLSQN